MSIKHDTYLLESLINGNEKGIAELYRKVFPKVIKFVLLNKGQRTDAEDIFHNVLLQLTARIRVQQFEITSSLEAYIFTACKNLWRRALNTSKKRVTNSEIVELIGEENDMRMAILEQERWELYEDNLGKLSENCRKILYLFFKKVTYRKIAMQFSYASENVVRQRVFKCKAKLTTLIKADPRYKNLKG